MLLELCPECLCTKFENDVYRAETICSQCGLILISPPCTEYIDADPIKIKKHEYHILTWYLYFKLKSIRYVKY